ncbi:MAG: amino acid adenylation domain-containing protein [Burkholderiaceae bacterium]|nr:amino acid adenylation domain-containing protein [Burkholderiaceae bacterium]
MADGRQSVAPADEDLQDSAPLRDFVPPDRLRHEMGVCPVPAVLRPRLATGRPAQPALLMTAVALLLARQARRERIAFVVRAVDGERVVKACVGRDLPVAQVMSTMGRELVRAADPQATGDAYISGVVVELGHHETPARADIVFGFDTQPDGSGGIDASMAYNELLYRAQSMAALARQLAHLLAVVDPDDHRRVGEVPLMDAAERHRVLRGFNSLRLPFPLGQTIGDLIASRAARDPGALCAIHDQRAMRFGDLDAAANRMAHLLVAMGIGPGQFVAVVDFRGLDFVIAVLATWKAGGAYIPVDPSYPEDRVRYMLADSEAAVAIVGLGSLARAGPALAACPGLRHVLCPQAGDARTTAPGSWISHGAAELQDQPSTPLGPRARPDDAAYMVYTSGSTGRPKGAIVRHDGAVNHLFAQAHALGERAVSRILQTAPSSSDISVWQIAAPLVFGGTTVIVDDATDVANLLAQVQRHRLQLIELVPVVMRYLVEYAASLAPDQRALPSLRWAMVTGESAPVDLVNAWLALYPQIPVVNAYGPTEAADDVSQAIVREPLPPRQSSVPIGQPLANLDLYVLDTELQPLPVGAPGEICIAGVGVGAGYWKQPDKTRQAFVPNPFPEAAGPTLYRTGDLGRWRDDGVLECLGRLDQQVQLRGFRIELPEIEAVLRQHAAVDDAVVQVFHDGRGDGQLVAYVVPTFGATPCDDDLRAHLAARLPPHMVPPVWVRMTALPVNPAGKVDRRALPAPQSTATAARARYLAPRSAAEKALAGLWEEELGALRVGVDDDFYALGGDSLTALAIAVGARNAGLQLRSADVLANPTVARLAAVSRPVTDPPRDGAGIGGQPSVALPAAHRLPDAEAQAFLAREPQYEDVRALTPSQQGIYLHGLLARDKTVYIDQYCYELSGTLDPEAFEAAWKFVAQRHAALRSGFLRSVLSQPAQVVRRQVGLTVARVDHSVLDPSERDRAFDDLRDADLEPGFDLAKPPLMRVTLVRVAPEHHRLIWTHHHIILDGWSLSLVLMEVLRVHADLCAGRPAALPQPVTWSRYADRLSGLDISPSEGFWRTCLAGHDLAPTLSLAAPREHARGFGQTRFELGADDSLAIASCARGHGVTVATLLQAAWAVLLSRHSGDGRPVFGVATSGRDLDLPGIDAMVGLFVTTLPLRIDTRHDGSQTLGSWLAEVQRRAAAIREHEAVPLTQIVKWCALPAGRALFESLFVMSNYPAVDATGAGPLRIAPAEFRTVPAYPLSLIVAPGAVLQLRLVHDRQRFDDDAIATLAQQYADLLRSLSRGEDPRATG